MERGGRGGRGGAEAKRNVELVVAALMTIALMAIALMAIALMTTGIIILNPFYLASLISSQLQKQRNHHG